jgi:hypothetical protein
MPFLTLDQTIENLLSLKAAGVPGDTAVARLGVDNSGRAGFMHRITHVGQAAVAKADFEKGWGVCKTVSTRGVASVSID